MSSGDENGGTPPQSQHIGSFGGAQTLGKRKLQNAQKSTQDQGAIGGDSLPTETSNFYLGVDLDKLRVLPNNTLEYDEQYLEELMIEGKH